MPSSCHNVKNDAAQEIHYRNHKQYVEEHGADCTFASQVCERLYYEPYLCLGSICCYNGGHAIMTAIVLFLLNCFFRYRCTSH
ncbi:hypothetical protein BSCG_05247 [Bacteroides sp. 2_2_4]|nr:hypothetical protein BSCG_05247 [Bacteroides sp. 2_2_4]